MDLIGDILIFYNQDKLLRNETDLLYFLVNI